MSATIIPLTPRFDPTDSRAERRYDGVVARMNRLSALRRRSQSEFDELERQFVEDDLNATSGPRRGQPLTTRGRRRRLQLLLENSAALRSQEIEWAHLEAELAGMNRALDTWARENWGLGVAE